MELSDNFSSSLQNNTDIHNYFCTDLLVGPVVWGVSSLPWAFVGLPASVWLLWTLTHQQLSGSSSNIYMLNLTIMDLVFNMNIIPNVLNFFVWHNYIFLDVSVFWYTFSLCGRPLFMACICVDCYMAVVHPITYMRMKNRRYRMVTSALVWAFTLVSGIFRSRYLSILIGFSAPVIAFCDLSILHALRKPDPSGKTDIHPQKRRAMQTITNSLVMTIVCYPPLLIVSVVSGLNILTAEELNCNVVIPSFIATTVGSTVMPLLSLGDLRLLRCAREE